MRNTRKRGKAYGTEQSLSDSTHFSRQRQPRAYIDPEVTQFEPPPGYYSSGPVPPVNGAASENWQTVRLFGGILVVIVTAVGFVWLLVNLYVGQATMLEKLSSLNEKINDLGSSVKEIHRDLNVNRRR